MNFETVLNVLIVNCARYPQTSAEFDVQTRQYDKCRAWLIRHEQEQKVMIEMLRSKPVCPNCGSNWFVIMTVEGHKALACVPCDHVIRGKAIREEIKQLQAEQNV
jgi:tRNA(Ile2) C34 agmatinyltransferase TiaS